MFWLLQNWYYTTSFYFSRALSSRCRVWFYLVSLSYWSRNCSFSSTRKKKKREFLIKVVKWLLLGRTLSENVVCITKKKILLQLQSQVYMRLPKRAALFSVSGTFSFSPINEQKKLNTMLWQPFFFLIPPPVFYATFHRKKRFDFEGQFPKATRICLLFFREIQKLESESPINIGCHRPLPFLLFSF